jgi:hypothetical protein
VPNISGSPTLAGVILTLLAATSACAGTEPRASSTSDLRAVQASATAGPKPSISPARNRATEGFAGCKSFDPTTDDYPDDADSHEPDGILASLHSHCATPLSDEDDLLLTGDRRVVLAVDWPTADAQSRQIFFFEHNTLVAMDDRVNPHQIVNLRRRGPELFEADYATGGSVAMPTSWSRVRFEWRLGHTPRPLDPIPSP